MITTQIVAKKVPNFLIKVLATFYTGASIIFKNEL
jgi:hypothetical protein